jgi:hypothetical protein
VVNAAEPYFIDRYSPLREEARERRRAARRTTTPPA